jgi:hypothetical protein
MSATIRPISLNAAPNESDRAPFSRHAAIAIRWEINPGALLASPGAAILNGEAARLKFCALVWHIDRAAARAELSLELTGNEHHTIALIPPTPIARMTADALEAIDAPGLLAVTLRYDGARPALLFARTTLLGGTLALPGGVYDAPTLG